MSQYMVEVPRNSREESPEELLDILSTPYDEWTQETYDASGLGKSHRWAMAPLTHYHAGLISRARAAAMNEIIEDLHTSLNDVVVAEALPGYTMGDISFKGDEITVTFYRKSRAVMPNGGNILSKAMQQEINDYFGEKPSYIKNGWDGSTYRITFRLPGTSEPVVNAMKEIVAKDPLASRMYELGKRALNDSHYESRWLTSPSLFEYVGDAIDDAVDVIEDSYYSSDRYSHYGRRRFTGNFSEPGPSYDSSLD